MKQIILLAGVIFLSTLTLTAQEFKIADGIEYHSNIFDATDKDDISCYRIPALITATNGDLIAAIDERVPSCGDLKWSKDINIVIKRSDDNGKTWTGVERVVDFPFGQSASDPSLILDEQTNDIFLFYNYMDLDNEKDVYYLHYVKSTDHGKTWSKPVDITSQICKKEWHNDFKFITSGRGIQTKNGVLLHTMVNLNSGLHLFGSKDHGKTWFFIDTPIEPADESKVIELEDGRWVINSRVRGAGIRYSHVSSDEGKTWTTHKEEKLIDPACNASIIRYTSTTKGYKKNRILFANAKNKKDRVNLVVRISYDEGKTWSEGKVVYEGGTAYSSLTILENGDIGVFFEKDGHKANEFVAFSLDWLTDGKDKYKKPKILKSK